MYMHNPHLKFLESSRKYCTIIPGWQKEKYSLHLWYAETNSCIFTFNHKLQLLTSKPFCHLTIGTWIKPSILRMVKGKAGAWYWRPSLVWSKDFSNLGVEKWQILPTQKVFFKLKVWWKIWKAEIVCIIHQSDK